MAKLTSFARQSRWQRQFSPAAQFSLSEQLSQRLSSPESGSQSVKLAPAHRIIDSEPYRPPKVQVFFYCCQTSRKFHHQLFTGATQPPADPGIRRKPPRKRPPAPDRRKRPRPETISRRDIAQKPNFLRSDLTSCHSLRRKKPGRYIQRQELPANVR